MKIQKLHIKNFKSLVDLEIVEPNPFTVFVGANGVGKSNIFEALEFVSFSENSSLHDLFGGIDAIQTIDVNDKPNISLDATGLTLNLEYGEEFDMFFATVDSIEDSELPISDKSSFQRFRSREKNLKKLNSEILRRISRVFIDKESYVKLRINSDQKLSLSCSNLEKVLKRLLIEEGKRDEIMEYLQLCIPEFEKLEIRSDNLSGTDTLLIYEKGKSKPLNKNLISDGTYNILCLITAVLQSDEPQFLCIEEPENGLTPYVIEVLVDMFRSKCEENGHYIWLNTHSQTLVRHLKEKELILVDKVDGATKITQLKDGDFYGLSADEAWLTNALGAGLPW